MTGRQFVTSKLFILMMIILGGFLINIKYKQYKQQKAIEIEKNNLTKQTAELENKNSALSQSLSYLSSLGFKEKVARQQLNLKRKDEQVFNFPENLPQDDAAASKTQKGKKSNFQKWREYFVKTNN